LGRVSTVTIPGVLQCRQIPGLYGSVCRASTIGVTTCSGICALMAGKLLTLAELLRMP